MTTGQVQTELLSKRYLDSNSKKSTARSTVPIFIFIFSFCLSLLFFFSRGQRNYYYFLKLMVWLKNPSVFKGFDYFPFGYSTSSTPQSHGISWRSKLCVCLFFALNSITLIFNLLEIRSKSSWSSKSQAQLSTFVRLSKRLIFKI